MVQQILINTIATAIGYYIISLALFGQFSYLKLISITLVTSVVIGAYSANYTFLLFENALIALLVAAITGGIFGYIGAILHLTIGREKEVLGLFASIGLFITVQGLLTVLTGGGVEPFRLPAMFLFESLNPDWLFLGLFLSFLTTILLLLLFKKSKLGLKAIATGDNFELALLLKQNPRRVEILVQIICGCVAGLAGVMIAFDKGLQPDLGFDIILKAFAILIITKLSIHYLFFWSSMLAFIEHIVTFYYGGQLGQATGLSIVVLVVLYTFIKIRINNSRIKNNLQKKINV